MKIIKLFENFNKNTTRLVKNISYRHNTLLTKKAIYEFHISEKIKRDLDLYQIVIKKISNGYLICRAGIDDKNVKYIKSRSNIVMPRNLVDDDDLGEYELQIIDNDTIELNKI